MLSALAAADTTFSFASDSNNDGPTFEGLAPSSIVDGEALDASGDVIVDLLFDANGDLPGGGSSFNSFFNFDADTTDYNVTAFGGNFIHSWTMSGSFDFVETGTGLTVLTIAFENALLTSFSSSSTALGTTATLQSSEDVDPGLAFTPGNPLIGLGITDLSANEGFAFTLTNIVSLAGGSVGLTQQGAFVGDWQSEGSFSAVAVPAPGALAMLGLAALAGRRRRRED
jgi:MYXO-CTERM domain-containing protein